MKTASSAFVHMSPLDMLWIKLLASVWKESSEWHGRVSGIGRRGGMWEGYMEVDRKEENNNRGCTYGVGVGVGGWREKRRRRRGSKDIYIINTLWVFWREEW
jgi:hypothetical protein